MPGKKAVFEKENWLEVLIVYLYELHRKSTQYLYSPRFAPIPNFPFSASLT